MSSKSIDTLTDKQKALLALKLRRKKAAAGPKGNLIKKLARSGGVDYFPLSFSQRRMWFLDQLDDKMNNNIFHAKKFENLHPEVFSRAFNSVIARHESWRTSFPLVDGEPMQKVEPHLEIEIPVVDVRHIEEEKRDDYLQVLYHKEMDYRFDLTTGPLVRGTFFRVNDTDYIFMVLIHHIIYDGFSVNVYERDLHTYYQAYLKNTQPELPELEIQYGDYSAWQNEFLQGPELEKQLGYWKDSLHGTLPVLDLPTDRPRPPIQTVEGGNQSFKFSLFESNRLKELAKEEQCTLFMVVLTGYVAMLHRYSRQNDIIVGVPISNRNYSGIENLIGVFINMIALRTEFDPKMTFRQLLRKVKEVTGGAFDHQETPFERVVDEIQPERDLSRTPVFQVTYNMLQDVTGGDNKGEYYEYDKILTYHKAKYDLTLVTMDTKDGLLGNFVYNIDLFNDDTMLRMTDHFKTICYNGIFNPDQPVDSISMLPDEEREKVLYSWNNTSCLYDTSVCMHELFEKQAEKTPDVAAAYHEGESITYRELNAKANQVARYLQDAGVGPESKVGLFIDRSLDLVAGMLGILKAGGAYIPLDPKFPEDRIRAFLETSGAELLLTHSELLEEFTSLDGLRIIEMDTRQDAISAFEDTNLEVQVRPDNLMYIIFTSGTTGNPKGIAVEHRNYVNYITGILKRMNVENGLSFALVSTFAADLGTVNVWAPFVTGGNVHLLPFDRAADPEAYAEYFEEHSIDVVKMVPSHIEALLVAERPERVIPKRLLILAGEACSWETAAKIGELRPECELQNHYGPTECTVSMLTYKVEEIPEEHHGVAVPLGRPIDNVQVYVLNAAMEPMPLGIPGELYIGGDGVARGYINNSEMTGKAFVPNPYGGDEGSLLYKTGDKVKLLPDGNIQFLGRVDHQIKIRGYRVEPGEIEISIQEYGDVKEAVVVAKEDAQGHKRLVAYFAVEEDRKDYFELPGLRTFLRESLPEYMVPTIFVELDAIPLNTNGKVDRKALPEPDLTQRGGGEYVAPRNETEERLAAIWAEVIGVEKVGIDDDFFDLGGDSFKSITVMRKFDPGVSVIELFKRPTIRELGEFYLGDEESGDSVLIELTPSIPDNKRIVSVISVPYGGGNAITFQPLAKELPKGYSLFALQIGGHDFSKPDDALLSLREMAEKCVDEIEATVSGPIIVYGHCVNGALAAQIGRILEERGRNLLGIFMGGIFPNPRLPGKFFSLMAKIFPNDKRMSDRAYKLLLKSFGGLSDDVSPEEQDFMLRSLRHDVREAEEFYTEAYNNPEYKKLKAPIVSVVGQKDRMSEFYQERYKEWAYYSEEAELAVIKKAGHYFQKHQPDVMASIVKDFTEKWTGKKEDNAPPSDEGYSIGTEGKTHIDTKDAAGKKGLKTFLVVAIGQLVSMIGTSLTAFAMGIWVYQKTGNVSDFAFISVFALCPGILLLPLAGAMADRFDRRKVMLWSDIAAAVSTLFMGIMLWNNALEIWHIYIAATVGSIANAFQRPAYMAAITQLVPKQYLGHANGLVQLSSAAGGILSIALGGTLIGLIGMHGILFIDFGTFLFALVTLLAIKFPNKMFRKLEEPVLKEMLGGFQYIFKRPSFVSLVIYFVVVNIFYSLADVLVAPLVLSFTDTATLGVVSASTSVGLLIGSVVMMLWGGTEKRAHGMIGFVAMSGIAIFIVGLQAEPIYPIIGLFFYGMSIALVNAHWQALIQSKVGIELQGRVFASNQMMALIMRPVSFFLAGPLADTLFEPLMKEGGPLADTLGTWLGTGPGRGIGVLFCAAGILLTIWVSVGFLMKNLRNMETILPDAVASGVITDDKDALQDMADKQLETVKG